MKTSELLWISLGLMGQFFFFLRFFIQWIASEKRKESTIPPVFWLFSILGGIILLIYSVYRRDPVFIIGQSLGIFIYARNLYFIHHKSRLRSTR